MRRSWLLLTSAAWAAWSCSVLFAQSSPDAAVAEAQSSSFFVNLDVDRRDRQYVEGEQLTVTVTSEIDAYAYVLYQPAQGKLYQIFPNRVQPDNKLKAKQPTKVPGGDDLFRFQVGKPFGAERLWVIASREPVDVLADPALQGERFNAVSNAQLEEALAELRQLKQDQWAASGVDLTTFSREDRPELKGNRYALCVGVGRYQFHEAALESQRRERKDDPSARDPAGLNLNAPPGDARKMAEFFQTQGGVAEVHTLVDEQATRANIEREVTGWLTQVTKPGDTVFIYFSGHGSQLPESDPSATGARPVNPDEPDNMEEYLCPYDNMSVGVLNVLLEQREQLPPEVRQMVEADAEFASQFPTALEQAWALVRRHAVTDDQMGHWLQRLSGRQVVVILDACKSGGFAESDAASPDVKGNKAAGFDFLDGEIVRLKGIGQEDQALLAACQPEENSVEITLTDSGVSFSLMTQFALDWLHGADRGARLEGVYAHCSERLAAESEAAQKAGRQLNQHVLLKNTCREAVVFKP